MFKWINKLKNKKGFTLIELIVVLAVLGIIALIAIPRFLTVQEEAKLDADYGTAAGIAKAAELYYVQATNPSTSPSIGTLTDGHYLDTFSGWQSLTTSDVTITIDTGKGSVTVEAGSTTLYPKP